MRHSFEFRVNYSGPVDRQNVFVYDQLHMAILIVYRLHFRCTLFVLFQLLSSGLHLCQCISYMIIQMLFYIRFIHRYILLIDILNTFIMILIDMLWSIDILIDDCHYKLTVFNFMTYFLEHSNNLFISFFINSNILVAYILQFLLQFLSIFFFLVFVKIVQIVNIFLQLILLALKLLLSDLLLYLVNIFTHLNSVFLQRRNVISELWAIQFNELRFLFIIYDLIRFFRAVFHRR